MLFVGREDDVVAHLATGDSGVVADNCVVEAHTEFEMYVFAEDEAHGNAAVFTGASIADNTIGKHYAVFDAGGSFLVGEDSHVVEGAGVFDDGMAADVSIASLGGCK